MNGRLAEWNAADDSAALEALMACCGARRWARALVAQRPFDSVYQLSKEAERVWGMMDETDWIEAFGCHPRVGERKNDDTTAQAVKWSRQEQASAAEAAEQVLMQLADGNRRYEERFGFTYIVCATGKSAEEMLAILQRRLNRDRNVELHEAAEQQRQIMQIRLGKWLTS